MSEGIDERLKRILKPVEIVLREDLEALRRMYSVEERIKLWNDIASSYKEYVEELSTIVDEELDKHVKGKFRMAQLLLAASFKLNNEDVEEAIKLFSEREYEILMDFESMKVIDELSVDDIVEAMDSIDDVRRVIEKYFKMKYNVLEEEWGSVLGDLIYGFQQRYMRRRRKIEEAFIKYLRKKGFREILRMNGSGVNIGDDNRGFTTQGKALALSSIYVSRLKSRLKSKPRLYDPLSKCVRSFSWSLFKDELLNTSLTENCLLYREFKAQALNGVVRRRVACRITIKFIAKKSSDDTITAEDVAVCIDNELTSATPDSYNILVIASPSRFSSDAIELACYKSSSSNTTVYLVELDSCRIHYNAGDKASVLNKWLFNPKDYSSEVLRAIEYILSREALLKWGLRGSLENPVITETIVSREAGASREAVREAFDILASEGYGSTGDAGGESYFKYSMDAVKKLLDEVL